MCIGKRYPPSHAAYQGRQETVKLTINQDMNRLEEEIIINCIYADERIKKAADYIRQFFFSLEAEKEGRIYRIPIEEIYYADSVDGRTFLYARDDAYEVRRTLSALEEQLYRTSFVRISKNCIMNTAKLKYVQPYVNHRMKAELENGEQLVISRNYIETLKEKLRR